jgi:hypothetical protein
MKRNLRQTLEIRDNVSDPKLKLHAAAIANDCYKYILDMSTKFGDIIRCFEVRYKKTEQVSTLQKLDERIESMEDREEITNGNRENQSLVVNKTVAKRS